MPREEMTIDEYRALTKARKYGNKKVTADGYEFDSLAEARRYEQLKLMEQAGAISDLRLQPRYELQRGFTDNEGKRQRAIVYVGDFAYSEKGKWIIEDTKGVETPVFKLKKKMFLYLYPHYRLRVTKVK